MSVSNPTKDVWHHSDSPPVAAAPPQQSTHLFSSNKDLRRVHAHTYILIYIFFWSSWRLLELLWSSFHVKWHCALPCACFSLASGLLDTPLQLCSISHGLGSCLRPHGVLIETSTSVLCLFWLRCLEHFSFCLNILTNYNWNMLACVKTSIVVSSCTPLKHPAAHSPQHNLWIK